MRVTTYLVIVLEHCVQAVSNKRHVVSGTPVSILYSLMALLA